MPKDFTTRITGQAKFDGATVKLDMLSTNDNFNPSEPVLPVAMLMDNPWQSLQPKSIDLDAKIEFKNRSAQIKTISLNQTIVAPGQDLVATVELQPWNQESRKVELRLTVPKDTPDGDYELAVGSSEAQLEQDTQYFPQRFQPSDVQDLVHDLRAFWITRTTNCMPVCCWICTGWRRTARNSITCRGHAWRCTPPRSAATRNRCSTWCPPRPRPTQ